MPLQPMVTGTRYMVSAGLRLATGASFAILEAGGNAFNACAGYGIVLGVVYRD